MGDVTAIYDEAGVLQAEYAYDAWGNCTVISDMGGIGALNPIRYRGYYWDEQIALYYLNARYYDPEVGRFISQDSIKYLAPETLNGINLFAYCLNNPVMYSDPTGHFPIWLAALAIGTFVSGLISGTSNAIQTAINGGSGTEIWASFAENAITGSAIGFAMTLGGIAAIYFSTAAIIASGIISVGVGFGAGIGAYWAGGSIREESNLNWADSFAQGAVTALASFNSFGAGYLMGYYGLFDNLKYGNGFKSFVSSAKLSGLTGINALANGGITYLQKYLPYMIPRSILKWALTFPYLNRI